MADDLYDLSSITNPPTPATVDAPEKNQFSGEYAGALDFIVNPGRQESLMAKAREEVKAEPAENYDNIGSRALLRSVPFISSGLTGIIGIKEQQAKERFDRNEASAEDIKLLAQSERYRQTDENRGTLGTVTNAVLSIPALLGETAITGGVGGGGGQITRAGLQSLATKTGLREAAAAAPGFLASKAAQTVAMPSMWAEDASHRAAQNGGGMLDVQNMAPALALGTINNMVLGQLQGASPVAGNFATRVATKTGLGVVEQQVADLFAGATGLTKRSEQSTGYGLIPDILAGKDGVMKRAISQVVTFGIFSGLHSFEGAHEDAKKITDSALDVLRDAKDKGVPPDQAASQLVPVMDAAKAAAANEPGAVEKLQQMAADAPKGSAIAKLTDALTEWHQRYADSRNSGFDPANAIKAADKGGVQEWYDTGSELTESGGRATFTTKAGKKIDLQLEPTEGGVLVRAFDGDNEVGNVTFLRSKDASMLARGGHEAGTNFIAGMVEVKPEYRRGGISNAMYDYVKRMLDASSDDPASRSRILPSSSQTKEAAGGETLWQSNAERALRRMVGPRDRGLALPPHTPGYEPGSFKAKGVDQRVADAFASSFENPEMLGEGLITGTAAGTRINASLNPDNGAYVISFKDVNSRGGALFGAELEAANRKRASVGLKPIQEGVAEGLRGGTLKAMRAVRDFVGKLATSGQKIEYEAFGDQRNDLYARVLEKAGYELKETIPGGKGKPDHAVWGPKEPEGPTANSRSSEGSRPAADSRQAARDALLAAQREVEQGSEAPGEPPPAPETGQKPPDLPPETTNPPAKPEIVDSGASSKVSLPPLTTAKTAAKKAPVGPPVRTAEQIAKSPRDLVKLQKLNPQQLREVDLYRQGRQQAKAAVKELPDYPVSQAIQDAIDRTNLPENEASALLTMIRRGSSRNAAKAFGAIGTKVSHETVRNRAKRAIEKLSASLPDSVSGVKTHEELQQAFMAIEREVKLDQLKPLLLEKGLVGIGEPKSRKTEVEIAKIVRQMSESEALAALDEHITEHHDNVKELAELAKQAAELENARQRVAGSREDRELLRQASLRRRVRKGVQDGVRDANAAFAAQGTEAGEAAPGAGEAAERGANPSDEPAAAAAASRGSAASDELGGVQEKVGGLDATARRWLAEAEEHFKKVASGSTAMMGVSPESIKQLIKYTAAKLVLGGYSFAKFVKEIIGTHGEEWRPHLHDMWEKATDLAKGHGWEPLAATSIKNETASAERAKAGLPEQTPADPVGHSYPELRDLAEDIAKTDPTRIDSLVKELKSHSRPVTDLEDALLLYRQNELRNQYTGALRTLVAARKQMRGNLTGRQALAGNVAADAFDMTRLEAASSDLRGRLQEITDVTKSVGTETARGLAARRMMANEDFSLAAMILKAEAAKGRPLTPEEQQKIVDQASQIKNLQEKLKASEAKLKAERNKAGTPKEQAERVAGSGSYKQWSGENSELQRAINKFNRGVNADWQAQKPFAEKFADWLIKLRQAMVISSPTTMGKVAAASAWKLGLGAAEEGVGGVLRQIPGLKLIADKADRQGAGFSLSREGQTIKSAFTEGMIDAWRTIRHGESDLDVKFAPSDLPRSWLDFVGEMHAAAKAPAVRAEYTRSLLSRLTQQAKRGVDISDPGVLLKTEIQAYVDSQSAKFQQDNRMVDALNSAVNRLRAKDSSGAAKAGGVALRLLTPVVRVPSNIVAEALFRYATGLPVGTAKAVHWIAKGVEKMPAREAEVIMQSMKKGSLGMLALAAGYMLSDKVGGFHNEDERKKPGDPEYGAVRTPAGDVPASLLHNPLMEVLHLGATARRVGETFYGKSKGGGQKGDAVGAAASLLGLIQDVPMAREMVDLGKLYDANKRGGFFGELLKSLAIPQAMQWLAGRMDTETGEPTGPAVKRAPIGPLQHIQSGIPGLRNDLPRRVKR